MAMQCHAAHIAKYQYYFQSVVLIESLITTPRNCNKTGSAVPQLCKYKYLFQLSVAQWWCDIDLGFKLRLSTPLVFSIA